VHNLPFYGFGLWISYSHDLEKPKKRHTGMSKFREYEQNLSEVIVFDENNYPQRNQGRP
jgi:hypothetical protein